MTSENSTTNIEDALKDNEKFWIDEPCILFTDLRFFPTNDMSKDEKLNALTRLVIVITAILYYFEYKQWLTFLILSILVIVLLKYVKKGKVTEGFSVTPTYQGLDFETTSVSPSFSEEWQLYPQTYDLYTNVAPTCTFDEPLTPQSYPYGQYLTRTNLLPSDEYHTHMLNGGTKQARSYANSTFLRNDLAFRENMTRIYKKSLDRRFRNNGCNDTFSPYSSY